MAAYVIAYLEVTDPKAFEVYRRTAGPTFGPYGGRPLVVDGQFEVLEGLIHPKSVVVVEFEASSGRSSGTPHPSTPRPSRYASKPRTPA